MYYIPIRNWDCWGCICFGENLLGLSQGQKGHIWVVTIFMFTCLNLNIFLNCLFLCLLYKENATKKNTLPTCSTKSESNISDELNFRCGITFDQQPMLRKDVKISLHQEIGCSWRLSRFRSFSFSKFPRTGRFWNQFSTVPNIKQNKLSSARFAHAMISKITFQQEGRVNRRFFRPQ